MMLGDGSLSDDNEEHCTKILPRQKYIKSVKMKGSQVLKDTTLPFTMTSDTWILLLFFFLTAYFLLLVNALPQQGQDNGAPASPWSPSAVVQSSLPSALPSPAGVSGGGLLKDFGKAKLGYDAYNVAKSQLTNVAHAIHH